MTFYVDVCNDQCGDGIYRNNRHQARLKPPLSRDFETCLALLILLWNEWLLRSEYTRNNGGLNIASEMRPRAGFLCFGNLNDCNEYLCVATHRSIDRPFAAPFKIYSDYWFRNWPQLLQREHTDINPNFGGNQNISKWYVSISPWKWSTFHHHDGWVSGLIR